MTIVFIGMETSGALRRRFQARGFETYSCDLLPSEDEGGEEMVFGNSLPLGRHLVGDVFEALDNLWANDLWPELAIFHPDCTYLTGSASWAYPDPDYERFPGVGYHQRPKPGTLVGAARREAREAALETVRRIMALKIPRKAIENPRGAIGTNIRRADQIIQPNQFGDDASKGTCLWLENLPRLCPTKRAPGRLVDDGRPQMGLFGTGVERWSNQSDGGQNILTPSPDRWKERSRTYPGIADANGRSMGSAAMTEENYRSLEKSGFSREDARLVVDLGTLAADDAAAAIRRVAERAPNAKVASAICYFALCAIAVASRQWYRDVQPAKSPSLAVRLISYFRRKEGQ